jgi:hypothetical protein
VTHFGIVPARQGTQAGRNVDPASDVRADEANNLAFIDFYVSTIESRYDDDPRRFGLQQRSAVQITAASETTALPGCCFDAH